MEALQTSNATLIKPAQACQSGRAATRRGTASSGSRSGILLGLGLAFLREALDTHVRTADSVARRLGLPILAQIPQPPRSLRERRPAGDARPPRLDLRRAVPHPQDAARPDQSRSAGEDDHGDERGRGRGEVDHGRQPRGRRGAGGVST